MRVSWEYVIARESRTCETISSEELLYRKVRELYKLISIYVGSNGDQAGACRKYSFLGIRRAPMGVEFRDPSGLPIGLDCENLSELVDTKRASCYREELENTISTFPLFLINALERAFVCFVQSFG